MQQQLYLAPTEQEQDWAKFETTIVSGKFFETDFNVTIDVKKQRFDRSTVILLSCLYVNIASFSRYLISIL